MIKSLEILKIVCAGLSAIFFFISTKNKLPEAPNKGQIIQAKPFEELFETLKKSSKQNSMGCIFLGLSLLADVIVYLLNDRTIF